MPRQDLRTVIAAYRKYGLTVEVVPGAETRGDSTFNPGCHLGHHTAGPRTGDRPSLQVVVEGRSDLQGPLAQDFLARSGAVLLVATGRANHAGLGSFRGILGNSGASGTEAEDDGDGTWTDDQLWAYPRVVAARLDLMGRDASWYCSHRTWANNPPSTPGRKIDPAGIADDWMRARVAPLQANPSTGGTIVPALDAADLKAIRAQVDASNRFYGIRTAAVMLNGGANQAYSAAEVAGLADLNLKAQLGQAAYLLMYGDQSDDAKDPRTHPNNMQELRALVMRYAAESGAREAALLEAVKAVSSGGVDLDAILEAAEQGATAALSRVSLVVAPTPAPAAVEAGPVTPAL